MAGYSLSRKADHDLEQIYEHSVLRFGLIQARTYLEGLFDLFASLAARPKMGREANDLQPGLRRSEHEAHVVFYKVDDTDVLIVRVLHRSMDTQRHFGGDAPSPHDQ